MTTSDLGIHVFGRVDQPIIIFPALFTPKRFKRDGVEQGKAKYSASFLFDEGSEELEALKATAKAVAQAKWGDDVDTSKLKFPFTKGTALKKKAEAKDKDGSFYEGKIMLKSSTEFKIPVLDGRKEPPIETQDEKLVYSGCYVAGEVNFNAYNGDDDEDGNTVPGGVNAYLNVVVFVAAGTRIAGKDHAAAFRGIKGSASKVDPTAGGDDDEIAI